MKKILIISLIVLIFFLQIAKADTIAAGEHPVKINNIITNTNDYPDYIFLSVGRFGDVIDANTCPIKNLEEGRILDGYYKFCKVSVYAIKKIEFNESVLTSMNYTQAEEYFSSSNVKEVISNITLFKTVSDIDPTTEINNSYNIAITETKDNPDKITTNRSLLFYLYNIIPIVALAIIVLILIKRKK